MERRYSLFLGVFCLILLFLIIIKMSSEDSNQHFNKIENSTTNSLLNDEELKCDLSENPTSENLIEIIENEFLSNSQSETIEESSVTYEVQTSVPEETSTEVIIVEEFESEILSDLNIVEIEDTNFETTIIETSVVDNQVTNIETENENETEISNTSIIVTKTEMIETTENIQESILVESLPKEIMEEVKRQEAIYPGMVIGVGIYSLDGKKAYEYNVDTKISGGCTVKAPYAMFVLEQCEKENINIWSETITYKTYLKNNGSGTIKESADGTQYTIAELLQLLLGISDNTAYNMLVTKFSLKEYQNFLNNIDGQQMGGFQYGAATVRERKNEWLEIYNYINSNKKYSQTLKNYLTGTKYCYLVYWMKGNHTYMHKSGWKDGKSYTSASDCAIIDDNYLIIVLTQDYKQCIAHTDVVKSLGLTMENYVNSLGGKLF